MFNRVKQNKTFISIVDIIAAFFTDKFINDLYYKARNRAHDTNSSVTDEYKRIATQYAYGVTNNSSHCKVVVSELHKYYSEVTKFASITYIDFEDTILSQFIPPEYYNDFASRDKTATMGSLVTKTVQSASVYVHKNREMLEYIIDGRNKPGGGLSLMMQDHLQESLMMQREEFYIDFARKINEKSQKVPVELMQKLRLELRSQVERRCKAETERDKALAIIHQLLGKIKALDAMLGPVPSAPVTAPVTAPVPLSYTSYKRSQKEVPDTSVSVMPPSATLPSGPQNPFTNEQSVRSAPNMSIALDNIDDEAPKAPETPESDNYYNISFDDFIDG
jgi:hypothetical protein